MLVSRKITNFFKLKARHTTVRGEFIAAATTFSTLAYSLILIPTVLAQAGMDFGSAMTATILASAFSTLLFGLLANYPFALAPGVALNAFFSYSVVIGAGYSWQGALATVFIAGAVFIILNILHIRRLIIEAIPQSLRLATVAGLGLFLAFIGLKNASIIVQHPATLTAFGNPNQVGALLTLFGLVSIAFFLYKNIPGAFFLGILLSWLLALFLGLIQWQGFLGLPSGLDPTFLQLDFAIVGQKGFFGILLSFVFIGLFDIAGTIVGLAQQGQFFDDDGKIPRLNRTLYPDAIGSMFAGLLGTSSIGIYLESAAGIASGGRSGLTAVFIAIFFLAGLFFAPFAASFPIAIITPVLIIIGAMMLKAMTKINWNDPTEWIPAFATLILIPLTSSVADGIGVGFILFTLLKLLAKKGRTIHWLNWILALIFILKFVFFE